MSAHITLVVRPVADAEEHGLFNFGHSSHSPSGALAGLQTWQIVAVAAGTLICMVLCGACLVCVCGSRKKSDKDSESNFGASSKQALDNGMSNLTIQTTMGASTSNLVSEKVHAMNGIGNIATVSDLQVNRAGEAPVATQVDLNSPLSPVQSWPADVLLGHYERVRQARERNEEVPVFDAHPIPVMRSDDQQQPHHPHLQQQRGGSCSSDSNQSRESTGSYEENALGAYGGQRDWRYENMAHAAVPYHHQGLVYDQYGYEAQPDHTWRDSYAHPARIETPTEYNVTHQPPFSYTAAQLPQLPQLPRRTNAVSQV